MTDRPDAAPPPIETDEVERQMVANRLALEAAFRSFAVALARAEMPCKTCGGAGQIPASGPGTKASLTMPCPDCGER